MSIMVLLIHVKYSYSIIFSRNFRISRKMTENNLQSIPTGCLISFPSLQFLDTKPGLSLTANEPIFRYIGLCLYDIVIGNYFVLLV